MTEAATTTSAASALSADGATATQTTTAAATTTTPPPADWTTGFDDDARGYVATKGFKAPGDLLTSYRNLEKLMGSGEKLVRPKGDDDAEGYNNLYKALGRPEKPDEYKLPIPEGSDPAFAKHFAPIMHKLGLSQKQAAGLAEAWNAHATGMVEADTRTRTQQSEADVTTLRQEWGGQYDANVEAGRRAARQFGLSADDLGKIESGLGTAGTFKLMAKLGLQLGEDAGVPNGTGKGAFATTKEQAQSEIKTLSTDKPFMTQYLNAGEAGHKAAKERMDRLHKIAYG